MKEMEEDDQTWREGQEWPEESGDLIIQAMSALTIDKVRNLESIALGMPQAHTETTHVFHAGLYCRTMVIPAGVMITGALIKIPTVLVVTGYCLMYGENGAVTLAGTNVLKGAAGRKQVFAARTDTTLTMIFATNATTLEEAEAEFTDETHLLITRREQ